jgi:hypothetical protein
VPSQMDSQKVGERFSAETFHALTPKPTQCLLGLPGLLVADMGIPHGGPDILVADEFLGSPGDPSLDD